MVINLKKIETLIITNCPCIFSFEQVGVKGNPQGFNRGLDCDVIVAEVRWNICLLLEWEKHILHFPELTPAFHEIVSLPTP